MLNTPNFGEAKTTEAGWMFPEKQFCDRKMRRIQQKRQYRFGGLRCGSNCDVQGVCHAPYKCAMFRW